MAEYENRERDYNDNLGQVVGRFCTAIVEADSEAKNAHVKRVIALVKQPNVELVAETSIIGVKDPLQTRVSVPVLAVTDVKPIQISNATLTLDMSVSASTSDTTNVASKTSVKADGKVGWGPFSLGVSIQADVSVAKESKRESDYRSTTHAEVIMEQGETPEGLMLIIDSLNQTTSKALEINQAIIQSKYGAVAEQAAASDDAPKPTDDGGDSGGSSGSDSGNTDGGADN